MAASEAPPRSKQQVLAAVRDAMAELGLGPGDVDPAAQLVDDLDLDSLDWVDLSLRLEETLAVVLREQRFTSLRTVQDVVDCAHAALIEGRAVPA